MLTGSAQVDGQVVHARGDVGVVALVQPLMHGQGLLKQLAGPLMLTKRGKSMARLDMLAATSGWSPSYSRCYMARACSSSSRAR